MKWQNTIVFVTVMLATAGCSSLSHFAVAEPVGPGKSAVARSGTLQVYTATEEHVEGDNTYYYPHTGYLVYTQTGQEVKSVINHAGVTGEIPSLTHLTPGSYVVVAEADGYGRVRIPVVVKENRATVVHLARGWKAPKNAQESDLVRMPDGQPIGWRSETGNHNLVSANSQRNQP